MLEHSLIKLGSTVSFDLYPVQLLGTSIKNAKVLGILDAATTMQLGFDAVAQHSAVYPTLPPATPNGYDKYHYLHLKLASGQKHFIGIPWIKEATWVEEMVRTIAIFIENVTPSQENTAVQALSANGLRVAKIEVQS